MLKELASALRPALVLTVLFSILLGLAYPAAMTGLGQLFFPSQANGSLIREQGRVIGSSLIGQNFTQARYFHGRPSAAGGGYDAAASAGSNLGPTSKELVERVESDLAKLRTSQDESVPPALVTTSASGLDPHISPEAAFFQARRVAEARGMSEVSLRRVIADKIDYPLFGFIGEERVNVLELNRALDTLAGTGAQRGS